MMPSLGNAWHSKKTTSPDDDFLSKEERNRKLWNSRLPHLEGIRKSSACLGFVLLAGYYKCYKNKVPQE